MPEEDHPIRGELAVIQIVPAPRSGQLPAWSVFRPLGAGYVKREIELTVHVPPPGAVLAAVPTRAPLSAAQGQVHLTSALIELFGNLTAGAPGADNQHAAGR